jgi:PEP-CTERM motif
MKRLSGALVMAVLLATSQATATPITYRDIADNPVVIDDSAGGSRLAAFSGFGSADGFGSAGMSASGLGSRGDQRSQPRGNGRFRESGWFLQNTGNAGVDFTSLPPGLAGLQPSPALTPAAPSTPPSITAVAEPSTLAMLGIGLTVAGIRRYRRKNSASLSLE